LCRKSPTKTCQSRNNSLTETRKQAHTTALERGDVRKRNRREQYGAGVEAVAVVAVAATATAAAAVRALSVSFRARCGGRARA